MVDEKERMTLDIEISAELRGRVEAAAASKGVTARAYCSAAVEEALDRDGRPAAAVRSRPLSLEAVESMRALKRKIFKGGRLPGNSAAIIRAERKRRAEQVDRASRS